jgi:hypothetical protein
MSVRSSRSSQPGRLGWIADRRPAARRLLLLAAAALTIGSAATAAAQYQFQVSGARCFGAAARDPQAPCVNPGLAYTVLPSPAEALITPSPACLAPQYTSAMSVCQFGASAAQAKATVALVGDSHAWHWKPAVEILAQREGWRGVSITRSSCPFSRSTATLSGALRVQCVRWNQAVISWFDAHPEVSTVFVSEHSGSPVTNTRQRAVLDRMVAGDIAAFQALPASVKHIIVIRDTPLNRFDTLTCVERAQARHLHAGSACALPRSSALDRRADAALLAARAVSSSRVRFVDLTPFFCDARLCYPVVGGVLVYRDIGHMTDAFSVSLGPYLLRAVARILPSTPPKPYDL